MPSSSSTQLEEALQEKLPAQFGAQPDLLFDPVSGRFSNQHVREPLLKVVLGQRCQHSIAPIEASCICAMDVLCSCNSNDSSITYAIV